MNAELYVNQCNGYNQIADIYDEDMGRNNSGEDIGFYVGICNADNTNILELGCGTGRITIPLAKAGCNVTGIDRSAPMLNELYKKAHAQLETAELDRVTLCKMDIASFAFSEHFSQIICPFSTLTYIIHENELIRVLNNIREHLTISGEFIFDVFVPDPALMLEPDTRVYQDYCRQLANGLFLDRSKTIRKNVSPGVNEITRNYVFTNLSGEIVRTITTVNKIRYHYPNQLCSLLQNQGFKIVKCYSDFRYTDYRDAAAIAVFVCKRTS